LKDEFYISSDNKHTEYVIHFSDIVGFKIINSTFYIPIISGHSEGIHILTIEEGAIEVYKKWLDYKQKQKHL
jgi:hypothetical protein